MNAMIRETPDAYRVTPASTVRTTTAASNSFSVRVNALSPALAAN
jgi:hypothetical protein